MLVSIEVLAWNFGGFGNNNAALDPRLDFNFLLGLWLGVSGAWRLKRAVGRALFDV
jgi:hypothetical protein